MSEVVRDFEAMHEMYQTGASLIKVASAFNIPQSTLIAGFQRRGLKTRPLTFERGSRQSQVAKIDDSALMDFKRHWETLDTKLRGTIIEGNIKNRLAELGFDVWMPYMNNHKADMGVFSNGRLVKIQCKCASYDPISKRFRAQLTTREHFRQHISVNWEGYRDAFHLLKGEAL